MLRTLLGLFEDCGPGTLCVAVATHLFVVIVVHISLATQRFLPRSIARFLLGFLAASALVMLPLYLSSGPAMGVLTSGYCWIVASKLLQVAVYSSPGPDALPHEETIQVRSECALHAPQQGCSRLSSCMHPPSCMHPLAYSVRSMLPRTCLPPARTIACTQQGSCMRPREICPSCSHPHPAHQVAALDGVALLEQHLTRIGRHVIYHTHTIPRYATTHTQPYACTYRSWRWTGLHTPACSSST